MGTADALEVGREAFERYAWAEAYAHLSTAQREASVDPEDLRRLAVAAYLTGRDAESDELWERAHHALLRAGDVPAAVRCAFWLVFGLFNRAEMARAGGWLARAQRLLDDHRLDCVERGYLLVPVATRTMKAGDPWSAYGTFGQAAELGARFGEPDLVTLGRLGQGMALIRVGRAAEGLTLLDEAMIAVITEEVSAPVAGKVYCAVIVAGQEVFDLRRAHEWAAALSDWCDGQPDLVPFRGPCLVHRSEILQLKGEWSKAMGEVQRARERLSDPPRQPALGMAYYQQGELHRVRGEFAEAEEAYRKASEHGHVPQPGLALLRLARNQVDAAVAVIRHAVDEAGEDQLARSKLLAAYVEIMLAEGDVAAARAAADELAGVAEDLDAPLLEAIAAHAVGAALLAEGDAPAALAALRRAWTRWWELEAPYERARVRVLIGLACVQLDDAGSAEMEWDSARGVFEELGAIPDLARVDELRTSAGSGLPGGLSAREVEVLALVAAGKTNREIAAKLVISEHTVRRHVQNIFTKLDLTSRASATAYAYEHDLVRGRST